MTDGKDKTKGELNPYQLRIQKEQEEEQKLAERKEQEFRQAYSAKNFETQESGHIIFDLDQAKPFSQRGKTGDNVRVEQYTLPEGSEYDRIINVRLTPQSMGGDGLNGQTKITETAVTGFDSVGSTLNKKYVVNFENDKSNYDPKVAHNSELLDEVAALKKLLREDKDLVIEVSGHTDAKGSNEYNQALSERRSNEMAALIKEKLPEFADRIKMVTSHHGEENLLVNTQESSEANRRVEINLKHATADDHKYYRNYEINQVYADKLKTLPDGVYIDSGEGKFADQSRQQFEEKGIKNLSFEPYQYSITMKDIDQPDHDPRIKNYLRKPDEMVKTVLTTRDEGNVQLVLETKEQIIVYKDEKHPNVVDFYRVSEDGKKTPVLSARFENIEDVDLSKMQVMIKDPSGQNKAVALNVSAAAERYSATTTVTEPDKQEAKVKTANPELGLNAPTDMERIKQSMEMKEALASLGSLLKETKAEFGIDRADRSFGGSNVGTTTSREV